MRKRPLGKTGIDVSEIGLGTWGLSGDAYGPVTDLEADRVIDRAVELGITLFDTADVYGAGQMEKRLGKRLPIGKTTVVTKIGTHVNSGTKKFEATHLYEAFDRSQERLNRNPVDVVLLHNPTLYTLKMDEPVETLERLKGQGRIKAWGVSAGNAAIAMRAIERGAELVEMAYNCTFFGDVEKVTPTLRDKGAGLLARSILAHGLLAGHWSRDREFYPPDHRAERWNPEDLKTRVSQLAGLRSVVSGSIFSMRMVALRYVLENADVSSAILGPRSCAQLDQLVRESGRMPPYLNGPSMIRLKAELRALGVTGE